MKKVLILEDDDRLRRTLGRALRKRGHEVSEAESLVALACEVSTADLDWAIIDLALPDGSGLEAVDSLLSVNPGLRIVILTGYGSIASAVDAVRRGAIDYLAKPADVDQLLDVLEPGRGSEGEPSLKPPSLERVEWEHIQRVLHDCSGNVTRAAAALGIHRRTLQRKLSYRPRED